MHASGVPIPVAFRRKTVPGAALLCCVFVTACLSASVAQATHHWGRPEFGTALAVQLAGGGPNNFKLTTLADALAGPNAHRYFSKLTQRFGARAVKQFVITFDYVVADTLRLVRADHVMLPSEASPDPKDGAALSAALYAAGMSSATGTFNADRMLDRLVSHSIRVRIDSDVRTTFGVAGAALYHDALGELMSDLATEHAL